MSVETPAPPTGGATGAASAPASGGAAASWVRRHRLWLLVAAGFVLAMVVAVTATGPAGSEEPHDPDNAGPDGARAVARVLEEQGVEVDVVRDAAAFGDAEITVDTTVVVTSTENLGDSTSRDVLRQSQRSEVVLVEPPYGVLDRLGVDHTTTFVDLGEGREGGCDDARFDGLTLRVDHASAYDADGCFDGDGGVLVSRPGGRLLVFGAGQALTNDQVLRGDNAAVVLRLLGQHRHLVWYVPSVDDLVGEEGVTLSTLLPDWIGPALWLGLLTSVVLVVWRGRRLGPLATEPLPVVVKAIETTRSRGRLYRKAGDRGYAAAALRTAARRSVADRLRTGSDPATLVRDVAHHVGRREHEVAALLDPAAPPPDTDKDLVRLAEELARLDREVRRA